MPLVGGIVLALVGAEAAFYLRDDGAFPHVNVYLPDPVVGARLQPGASERISFAGNPVTTLRINSEGYRGADWGAPGADEIVVIGDSQVTGLGVEEGETASAVLASSTGRTVRNAGTPTWGPPEYLTVLDELLAARNPKTVVLVINFANDLFERDRPNTGRHVIWDGWAARTETAPDEVTSFPGRHWIFSKSHLVYAIRRLAWDAPSELDAALPSEGGLRDLLPRAEAPMPQPEIAQAPIAQAPIAQAPIAQAPMPQAPMPQSSGSPPNDATISGAFTTASAQRGETERRLAQLYADVFPKESWQNDADLKLRAVREHKHPGDIVGNLYAEESRGITVTAATLKEGAALRNELEPRLKKWAAEHADTNAAKAIVEAIAARENLDAQLSENASLVYEDLTGRSVLADFVRDARDRAAKGGAEVVIVALPVDVQVSADEWKKYGTAPIPMDDTRVLLTDLVGTSERFGVRALDATAALAAAEPGAFLDGDIHMTAKGQAALAGAIAAKLAEAAPLAAPGPGLPAGRSRLPDVHERELATEIVVTGSSRNHCSTRQRREWLVVDCSVPQATAPRIRFREGSLETMVRSGESRSLLLTPLIPGRTLAADFDWKGEPDAKDEAWRAPRRERLTIRWDGKKPLMAFSKTTEPFDGEPEPPGGENALLPLLRDPRWIGDPTRGCLESYASDGAGLAACADGSHAKLPACHAGKVNAGSAGFCFDLCDTVHACVSGVCTDWQGAGVCL